MNAPLAAAQTDPWAMWRIALVTKDRRKLPAIDLAHPEQGYYRLKRNGKWVPVFYWWEADGLHCLLAGEWFSDDLAEHLRLAVDAFTWAWQHPITEEVYDEVMAGGRWPDLDEVVEEQVERERVGGNNPPADELTDYKIQIENASAAVDNYKAITSDDMNGAAQSVRARLNELALAADKVREAKKRPHWEAGKKVDADWMPLVARAKEAAEAVRLSMKAWVNKKAALQQAEEDKRRAAAAEEQRAADRAIASGTPPSAMEAPVAPPEPELPIAAPPAPIKGGYGRAASIPLVKIGTIVDQDAVYRVYRDRQQVKDALQKLVNADVKNGHTAIAGVEIKEERDVR